MEKEQIYNAIIAYKGFDKNLCCRGFQYEVGKEYEQEGEIACCSNGFHACENPFDVLDYYDIGNGHRFCKVEQSGTIDREDDQTKTASSKIKIKAEIGVIGLFKAGIEWIQELTNLEKRVSHSDGFNDDNENSVKIGSSGYYAQIGSSGYYAKIGSSGDYAKIGSSGISAHIGSSGYAAHIGSSGYYAKIGSSGDYAQIGSSGYSAHIGSSGDYAQIGSSSDSAQIWSSGDSAKIGSSGHSAQIWSSGYTAQIGSSGDSAKIWSIGDSAQIVWSGGAAVIWSGCDGARIGSSGYAAHIWSGGASAKIGSSGDSAKIESIGEDSVICCAGDGSIAKAKQGSWIILSEWKFSDVKKRFIPVCVKTEYVDGERIKADTWYKLVNGEFKAM